MTRLILAVVVVAAMVGTAAAQCPPYHFTSSADAAGLSDTSHVFNDADGTTDGTSYTDTSATTARAVQGVRWDSIEWEQRGLTFGSGMCAGGGYIHFASESPSQTYFLTMDDVNWDRESGAYAWNLGPSPMWVYFKDKGFADQTSMNAALENLKNTYDKHAIERRKLRRTSPGLFDVRDLAVSDDYTQKVVATGATLRNTSKWLNAISVNATDEQVAAIKQLACVSKVEPVRRWKARYEKADDTFGPPEGGFGTRGLDYGYSKDQIEQMNLAALHDAGYTGAGVRIAILDTGFNRTHAAFNNPDHPLDIIAEHDFINDDDNTAPQDNDGYGQWFHGTWILGTIGAYKPGELIGAAFDASFILCKTEDIFGEYQKEEDNYVAGLEFAEENGADMTTSSLGYIDWYNQSDLDGRTAVTTIGINAATDNGLICCTAMGNQGHDDDPATMNFLAPADAFHVIACGAVWYEGSIAGFSSDGPTADGRLKPEILARGVNTISVSVGDDVNYDAVSGTSLSTPLVASSVACLIQAHPDWTVDQMRGRMFYSATDYVQNGQPDATYVRGFGIVNAYDAHSFVDCNGNGIDDLTDIENGDAPDVNGNFVLDDCEHLGDLDCDGATNFNDIDAFVDAILGRPGYDTDYPGCDFYRGDMNLDFNVDFNDIDGFVNRLVQ